MSSKTEEHKAEIIALLMQGKAITEISKTLQISKASVSRIKDDLIAGKYETQLTKVQNNLSECIADSLLVHLDALNKIAKVATDENYLITQDAKSISELHKQITNWTLDILQAGSNVQSYASSYVEAELIESNSRSKD